MRSRLWPAVALWLGLVGALLVPTAAFGQEGDLGAVVAETRALTERLRADVAALGGGAPPPALIADFARRRDRLAEVAGRDAGAAVGLAFPPGEIANAPAALQPLLEQWTYRVGQV